jgi:hypothetical protein
MRDRHLWLALLVGLAVGFLYVALLWCSVVLPYAGR